MAQVTRPEDVTAGWLSNALGHSVESFDFSRIGSGQVAECYRFEIKYANEKDHPGPASVVLKVAAQDQKSRRTGVDMGLYQREVLFYQQIAPELSKHMDCISATYHASYNEADGTFALLLSDAVHKKAGNDIQGATYEQAQACVRTLGKVHGQILRTKLSEGISSWLKRDQILSQQILQDCSNVFVARFRDKLTVEHHQIVARIVACYDAYKKRQQEDSFIKGVIHGDYRLDNILVGEVEDDLTVVDWQTIAWAPVLGDLAYFLGSALTVETRRAHMDELLRIYHDSLGPDTGLNPEIIQDNLRKEAFFGVIMCVAAAPIVAQTERGDQMFATMTARHCQLVIDLDSVKTLPTPVQLVVLQPAPEDEGLHPRSADELFNESYYLDFVDEKQDIAGYVRLGITPNVKKGGWYIGLVSRRGKPLVSVVDYGCPIPDDTLQLKTNEYTAGFKAVEPLKTFETTLSSSKAKLHNDPATIFRGDSVGQGTTDISFKLAYHTDGVPYKYRMTTRYEIPCVVDGQVIVDGEKYELRRVPGQRDHSWGVRDWWNMDWLWSSAHFEDGSHFHAVHLTARKQGSIGIGYYQTSDKEALELSDVSCEWHINPETNLVDGTTLKFTPVGLQEMTAEITAIGHGPMRLVSDEGKVALFDRAWCNWDLQDGKKAIGRKGTGWVEWNRVQDTASGDP